MVKIQDVDFTIEVKENEIEGKMTKTKQVITNEAVKNAFTEEYVNNMLEQITKEEEAIAKKKEVWTAFKTEMDKVSV